MLIREPLILAIVLLGAITALALGQSDPILLWPGGAPGALGDKEEDRPTLTPYLLPSPGAHSAVVICPGGGYVGLAVDHEGQQVARWFNSIGVSAFVLKYRVGKWDGSGYRHPIPLLDAQRAIRIVRARAGEWNVNPNRVGILGFSAGGHLASTAGTHFDAGRKDGDAIERESSRPSFLVLVYPVISFTTKYTHRGSRQALLGQNPDPALVENLSNEKQVTSLTPPTFLIHTTADKGVPPENSILFYTALRDAGVPAELHIYERGEHGFGLAPADPVLSSWPERLKDWLRVQGLIAR